MNSDMVKSEKFDHLHLVYHFTVPLKDGKFESDFKIKANYFNIFFASQCTPLVNNSKLQSKLLITLQLDLLHSSLTIMIFLKLSGL